ncbi:MAG: transposase [Coriobacteriaceae bacterium]|nr:transposase [Coriobacteriaceae bacterium]
MGSPSPRYTAEFKQKAVEPYIAAGPDATYAEIARGLGIDAGSLSKWASQAGANPSEPEQNPFRMAEGLRCLRREDRRPKTEDEMLSKAGVFFASRLFWRSSSTSSAPATGSGSAPPSAG